MASVTRDMARVKCYVMPSAFVTRGSAALSFLFYLFLSSFRKLGLKSGFTRSCGFSSENGCFSYIDFVSFSKIQSNDALPRGGGICGNAHMRKRDSRVENGRFSYVDFVSFLENQSNFALQISFAHMSASINTPS